MPSTPDSRGSARSDSTATGGATHQNSALPRGSRFASFNRASPTRTPSSSATIVATGRKCPTRTCSSRSPMFRRSPTAAGPGGTTKSGRTTRWEACRQRATARSSSQRNVYFRTVYLTGKLTKAFREQSAPWKDIEPFLRQAFELADPQRPPGPGDFLADRQGLRAPAQPDSPR
jgi:hypothetical protein